MCRWSSRQPVGSGGWRPGEYRVAQLITRQRTVETQDRTAQRDQPLLMAAAAAPFERRVVVALRPREELLKRAVPSHTPLAAHLLAGLEPSHPLGRVQGQEHHGVTTPDDVLTPAEHRAGQHPALPRQE